MGKQQGAARKELLTKVRPIAQDLGVKWMVAITAHHSVDSLSGLPTDVLRTILRDAAVAEAAQAGTDALWAAVGR